MTIEQTEPEPRELSDEERREARLRSYRSVASGLIIQGSRYLGTFDMDEMDPKVLTDWMRLATQLYNEADGADVRILAEHRRRYLETITNDREP